MELAQSHPSAPPASPTAASTAAAARMLPSTSTMVDPEPSPHLEPKDGNPATPPAAAAADGDEEEPPLPAAADGDAEALAPPAARAGADRICLRPVRITMRSLRHALNGVARAGHIVGGAYRRSLVARYVSGSSALCVRCYHRSFLPGYVSQRLLVAFSKASSFYSNVEWLRMELARERPQLPPPVAEQQQLIPPVGEKQQILPHVAEQQQQQQLPPPVSEQQQHPPPSAEQQQLPPPVSKQQQHPPPLPPELDLC